MKIKVFVGDDYVGGKLVTNENSERFSKFVDALKNNQDVLVVKTNFGDMIYDIGSKFNESKNVFVESKSKVFEPNLHESATVFSFISNSTLVYVDILENGVFDSLIAAYQSNPTFVLEEVSNG